MTCIVGYVQDGAVYIGGDSAGVGGRYDLRVRADEKVFVNDEMIFGFTTSFRMGQILRYSFKAPDHPKRLSDYEYLCTKFIDELIECFKKKGFAEVDKNEVKGGSFLLGYKGNLYSVEGDFQVGKVVKNYDACGCGQDYAIGALFALEQQPQTPEEKVRMALEAAEQFSGGVRKPFHILKLGKYKED